MFKRIFTGTVLIAIIITLEIITFMRLLFIGQANEFFFALLVGLLLISYIIMVMCLGIKEANKKCFTYQTASIFLMLISVLLSFENISGTVEKGFKFVPFLTWKEEFSTCIRPSLRSFLFSILLVLSFFVRNRLSILKNPLSYVILSLDLLFISSFINVMFNNSPWPIPFINIDDQTFLIVAVLFSWFGIRAVSGVVWLALIILGISRMISIETVWGFTAVLYLLFAFVSFMIQFVNNKISLHDAGEFIAEKAEAVKTDINKIL